MERRQLTTVPKTSKMRALTWTKDCSAVDMLLRRPRAGSEQNKVGEAGVVVVTEAETGETPFVDLEMTEEALTLSPGTSKFFEVTRTFTTSRTGLILVR